MPDFGDVLMVFIGFLFFILAIALICRILYIVGLWKAFKKADVPGWKSLIPFYNTYVSCQFCGADPIWIFIILGAYVVAIFVLPLAFVYAIAGIYFNN